MRQKKANKKKYHFLDGFELTSKRWRYFLQLSNGIPLQNQWRNAFLENRTLQKSVLRPKSKFIISRKMRRKVKGKKNLFWSNDCALILNHIFRRASNTSMRIFGPNERTTMNFRILG